MSNATGEPPPGAVTAALGPLLSSRSVEWRSVRRARRRRFLAAIQRQFCVCARDCRHWIIRAPGIVESHVVDHALHLKRPGGVLAVLLDLRIDLVAHAAHFATGGERLMGAAILIAASLYSLQPEPRRIA
jgi:hypothetical protein